MQGSSPSSDARQRAVNGNALDHSAIRVGPILKITVHGHTMTNNSIFLFSADNHLSKVRDHLLGTMKHTNKSFLLSTVGSLSLGTGLVGVLILLLAAAFHRSRKRERREIDELKQGLLEADIGGDDQLV